MAEAHVIGALRHKRAELAGMLRQLEQQLVQQRANLTHVDATMRLFDPDIRPKDIRPKQLRARIDPFVRLHRIDENVSGDVAPLLAFLRELQRRHAIAVALVHHAKKGAGAIRAGQALRGSSEFHAWVIPTSISDATVTTASF